MISIYLVIYLSAASLQKAPIVIAPMIDMETCLYEAEKLNAADALKLSAPEAKALGAEVACARIVRATI